MDAHHDDRCELRIHGALRSIIRAVDVYSRKLNTVYGLTMPQLVCLHTLAKSPRMTLTELARAINLGISTVNGIIDRLEAKQYLTRTRSIEDRRKVYAELTVAGRDIVENTPSLLQDRLAAALAHLPEEEQLTIAGVLERIASLMQPESLSEAVTVVALAEIVR